jgi:hypothetical protein
VTTGGRSGHRQTAVPPTPSPAIPSSTTISESGFYFVMGGTALASLAGGEWSVVATPTPAPVASQSGAQATPAPASIACPTPDDCWAVGEAASGHSEEPLIEAYDGTGWTVTSGPLTPVPTIDPTAQPSVQAMQAQAELEGSYLDGVTCVGADDCWAVGSTASTDSGLIENFNGSAWTVVVSPKAPKSGLALAAVTCVGVGDCWAVGDDGVENYDGTVWNLVAVPSDDGAPGLESVACIASDDCWAVGAIEGEAPVGSTPVSKTLIEHWQGSQWVQVTPLPPGIDLGGVACTGAGSCWAVGAVIDVVLVTPDPEPLTKVPPTTPSDTANPGGTPSPTGTAG